MAEISKPLTDLPDSLLEEVLSFLPTEQSVRTCILSNQWKTLWTRVPVLDFDDSLKVDKSMFEQFVYFVLRHHKAKTIKRFSLVCNSVYDEFDVAFWVGCVMRRKVIEVELSIRLERPPRRLFNSDNLSIMKLKSVSLEALDSFSVCLPELKVLQLRRVSFKQHNNLVKLLHGCPKLKELVVVTPYLGCKCGNSDRKFELNMENLSRAHIGFSIYDECMKVLFFHAVLCNVQSLFISLGAGRSLGSIPVAFMNLKQLEVFWGMFYWDQLIAFLKSCPQLEQLIISKNPTFPLSQSNWIPIPDTPLDLNIFCMKNYEGSAIEPGIVCYVLKNASELETLKINFASSLPSQERVNIVKGLSELQKNNNINCQLLFDP